MPIGVSGLQSIGKTTDGYIGKGASILLGRLTNTLNQRTITLEEPTVKSSKPSGFVINETALTDISPTFGVPISWVNYSQQDKLIWGDGIQNNKIYVGGTRGYDLGIVAPKIGPTLTDASTASAIIFPIAGDLAYTGCGGTHNIFDTFSVIGATPACQRYTLLDDTSTADYIFANEWTTNINTKYSTYQLATPPFIPTVTTGHSFTFKARYDQLNHPHQLGYIMNWTATLYSGATVIKTVSYTQDDIEAANNGDNQISAWKEITVSLSSGEAATINDYTNLRIEFTLDANDGSNTTNFYRIYIAYCYATIPATNIGIPSGSYDYVITYVRSTTGVESGPSPVSVLDHLTNGCVIISDILLSDDLTVDFINIYRTVRGGGTYFLDKTIANSNDKSLEAPGGTEITAFGTASENLHADEVQDCMDDSELKFNPILNIPQKRLFESGLPIRCRYFKSHLNRIWGAGAYVSSIYSAGHVEVQNNSITVIGIGAHWTDRMIGRQFNLSGAPSTQTYTIAKVISESELKLTTVFNEATTTSYYEIKDTRNPYTLYWSFPGFPEDWPVVNGLTIEGEQGEGITGLAVVNSRLLVFTKDSIYMVSGNDESNFRIDLIYKGVGCLSGHTIVETGDFISFLDHAGWYLFAGSGTPIPISSPNSQQGEVVGIDRTVNSMVWQRSRMATAFYDTTHKTFHTFISLDGDFENNDCLVYDTVVKSWAVDDVPGVFSSAVIYDHNNEKTYLLGNTEGIIYQMNIGDSDNAYNSTIVATITAANSQVITCGSASFPTLTPGLQGTPIYIVDRYGNFWQNRILNNDATHLNLVYQLQFIPDNTYKVIIGGIPWLLRSGYVDFGNIGYENVLQFLRIANLPQQQGKIYVKSADNFHSLEINDYPLDLKSDYSKVPIRKRGRHIQTELFSIIPFARIEISTLEWLLAGKSEGGKSRG